MKHLDPRQNQQDGGRGARATYSPLRYSGRRRGKASLRVRYAILFIPADINSKYTISSFMKHRTCIYRDRQEQSEGELVVSESFVGMSLSYSNRPSALRVAVLVAVGAIMGPS